MEGDQEKY